MPSWLLTTGQGLLGLTLLYYGGEWLVRGASALAAKFGISPLAIGLTVVAFGTSAPELVVSLAAALSGASDIAVGNVVGSNIANLGLILGLAAAIRMLDVQAKIIRIDAPLLIGVSALLLALLADGEVTRLEGALLVLGLVAYIAFTLWESRRETAAVQAEFTAGTPYDAGSTLHHVLVVVAGLAALVAGGKLLVTAAVTTAAAFGVSEAVIGDHRRHRHQPARTRRLVIAALRGQGDIALGNVIGSNLFNVLASSVSRHWSRPCRAAAWTG